MQKKEFESNEKKLDIIEGIKQILENFSNVQKERNKNI